MIDLKDLRENPDRYRKACVCKGYDASLIDQLCDVDAEVRKLQADREQMTAEKNRIGKEMGQLAGRLKKASPQEQSQIKDQMQALKARPEELKQQEQLLLTALQSLEPKREALWLQIPLPPDPSVPVGKSAEDNVEASTWHPENFDPAKSFEANKGFAPRSHIELMEKHGMVSFDRGVKIAGSRSYLLTGAGMALHQAVLRAAFDFMTMENGFTGVSVPVLVREDIMVGTGFFPLGKEDVYHISNSTSEHELYLTGTGEVGLMGMHADEIVDADSLPLCYTTVSTCFRREAGSAGKETAGLYRIHQFDKVEQVVICRADEEDAKAWHRKMIGFVETFLQRLELPYRLLQCCTADIGAGKADMIDVECWMPSRGDVDQAGLPTGAYGETHSASRLNDYQCRRLNIRYKDEATKKNTIAYSLNNTVAASPRILIPIVELFQNEDGSITIPQALRPYMNGQTSIG